MFETSITQHTLSVARSPLIGLVALDSVSCRRQVSSQRRSTRRLPPCRTMDSRSATSSASVLTTVVAGCGGGGSSGPVNVAETSAQAKATATCADWTAALRPFRRFRIPTALRGSNRLPVIVASSELESPSERAWSATSRIRRCRVTRPFEGARRLLRHDIRSRAHRPNRDSAPFSLRSRSKQDAGTRLRKGARRATSVDSLSCDRHPVDDAAVRCRRLPCRHDECAFLDAAAALSRLEHVLGGQRRGLGRHDCRGMDSAQSRAKWPLPEYSL